jgi:hypothetical protein
LQITPTRPHSGESFDVLVHGVRHAVLRCNDGRWWPVTHGSRIGLLANRPIELILVDCDGQVLISRPVTIAVAPPQLMHWPLPDELAWTQGWFDVPMPDVLNGHVHRTDWRPTHHAAWRPLPAHRRIPLPPRRSCIELRMSLHAKDAERFGCSPVTVDARLQVVPPPVSVVVEPLPAAVQRYQPVQLKARLADVHEASLLVDGVEVAAIVGKSAEPLTLDHELETGLCGCYSVQIDAVNLAGERRCVWRTELDVRPRAVQVSCEPHAQWPGLAWRVKVHGAAARRIRVPAWLWQADMPTAEVVLELRTSGPTLCEVVALDDRGDTVVERFELESSRHPWITLPAMRTD